MKKFQLTGIACSLAILSISSAPTFAQTTGIDEPIRNRSRGPMISGIDVPEEIAPVTTSVITVHDQHTVEIVQRIPVGEGLFPVIVFVHGGHRYQPLENRIDQSLNDPSITRLLAAGFGVVLASFRSHEQFEADNLGPVEDLAAILEELRISPRIDPNSIIMLGHSSGGRLTLELAGRPEAPTAVIVSEPATTLLAELFPDPDPNVPRDPYTPNMDVGINFEKYHNSEKQIILENKVQRISPPVMLIHSDVHPVNRVNAELLIPALTKYNKLIKEINYPGYGHGYLHGRDGMTEEGIEIIVTDIVAYSNRYIAVKPRPLSF